ncbi:MAG: cyclic nucleotide-binding domain-containing protein [Fervidobacterium sp.]|uniref:cyclic nucleotide-binding domain-containing protein n=1 Tax=Fervidobacterium sp. TaxID=1871331 RepID=UPI00404B2253
MKIEGVIFKSGEIPKKLFKIQYGTIRETRNRTYHDLSKGDYVALLEYLLEMPLEEDVVALEESEIIDVSFEDEYENIIKKILELRKILYETSVDLDKIVLDDFNFETPDLDEYLEQVESLLTLSGGELPENKEDAIKMIESIEDDKLITKVNLVKKFSDKFPEEPMGAKFLIETAAKVYILLNDKYIAKSLLKKVLLRYSHLKDYCYEAVKTLESIYKDEGNIIYRRYSKIARVLEVMLRGNS